MPVCLVRHACAGDKAHWSGPDAARPLDAAGALQASALVDVFATMPVHRILTSPARRCVETVQPLAEKLDIPVEVLDVLLPEGDSVQVRRLITALDARAVVVCTHGEHLRELLAEFRVGATAITARRHDDEWLLQKGTGWALTLDSTGAVVALDHVAPYPLVPCPVDDPPGA